MNILKKILMVRKKNLIIIAGIVWFIAGINVARLGILAYMSIESISIILPILSIIIFSIFGLMFNRLSEKNICRIINKNGKLIPFWNFFELKSYMIMIFMMSGGILLRKFNAVPNSFIAFFYTGLGSALGGVGIKLFVERARLNKYKL